jgi:hypothetical protein
MAGCWATHGRLLGYTWQAAGLHMAGCWATHGRLLGYTWQADRMARGGCHMGQLSRGQQCCVERAAGGQAGRHAGMRAGGGSGGPLTVDPAGLHARQHHVLPHLAAVAVAAGAGVPACAGGGGGGVRWVVVVREAHSSSEHATEWLCMPGMAAPASSSQAGATTAPARAVCCWFGADDSGARVC